MSVGMLSKINISASLCTLDPLSKALGVGNTAFFRGHGGPRSASFVKAGDGMNIERCGTRARHHYSLLGYLEDNRSGVVVEPY